MSSAVDKIGIQGVRAFALVLGVIGLLLDLTLIGIAVGAVVGFFGVVSALLCPRDRFRMIVLSLNVFALVVVGVFVLLFNVA
jgi:ABC-type microcin C transport system permease subunit YejE